MKVIDKIHQMDSHELANFIFIDLFGSDENFCFLKCKEYSNTCGARCRKNMQEYFESERI